MTSATRRLAAELAAERRKRDALLDVLNGVLLAYGQGPECRLAVSNAYLGKPRRNVATEPLRADAFIVYLEKQQEDPDGPPNRRD